MLYCWVWWAVYFDSELGMIEIRSSNATCSANTPPIWTLRNETIRSRPLTYLTRNSIKKPKTHRYPSLKGVDPKFRRNHRHALHGTMKALVR